MPSQRVPSCMFSLKNRGATMICRRCKQERIPKAEAVSAGQIERRPERRRVGCDEPELDAPVAGLSDRSRFGDDPFARAGA